MIFLNFLTISVYPPWILKRAGQQSSSQIASSKYWKTKRLAFFFCNFSFYFFILDFEIFQDFWIFDYFWQFLDFRVFLKDFWISFRFFFGIFCIFFAFIFDLFDFLNFLKFLDFWIFFLFFGFFWIPFQVTKVTSKSYQGYYWAQQIAKNRPKQHNKLSFFAEGQKCPLSKAKALRRGLK